MHWGHEQQEGGFFLFLVLFLFLPRIAKIEDEKEKEDEAEQLMPRDSWKAS
jgi:hypothetical protein